MTDAAPLAPEGEAETQPEDFRRPMRPGTTSVPDEDPAKVSVEQSLPADTRLVRQTPYMTEVYVEENLIGVVQATSTAEGPWEFRHMPGWANRDQAERAAGPMCRAAVDAARE